MLVMFISHDFDHNQNNIVLTIFHYLSDLYNSNRLGFISLFIAIAYDIKIRGQK